LEDKIGDIYRKDYFFQIYNKIIKRQLERYLNKAVAVEEEEEENIEPVIKYQLAERIQL
jgi:hypothetical protein